jgi:phosphoserine phosphatase
MKSPHVEDELLAAVANRLFVFDMDGTLWVRTTACIEIAKVSGTLDQLHILEQKFAAGEIDAFCFAQNIGALWACLTARLSERHLNGSFSISEELPSGDKTREYFESQG